MEIAQFPVFAGMDATEIEQIVALGQEAEFVSGQQLTTQGAVGDRLMLITRGRVQVHIASPQGEHELMSIDAPCVVGELELLHPGTHAASVSALDSCWGYAIPYAAVQDKLGTNDVGALKFACNLAKLVASRLYALDHRLAEMIDGEEPVARQLTDLSNRAVLKKLMDW